MKTLILPYGEAGWTEKVRVLERIVAARPAPPHLYNDVLIIVHASRMKRTYGRLFLDAVRLTHGASALVRPEILSLHEFFSGLYARLHGPTLIDENSRLILIEGMVKERLTENANFNQDPDLLAPSLSAALGRTIEQLSAAGVSPGELSAKIQNADFSGKPQVGLLLDIYARYERALHDRHLTDPAGMRLSLLTHFDEAWLAPYREIVIDGIQDADALEAGLISKVAGCGNCTCLIDAPSMDLISSAPEFHPLRIVKDFLSRIGVPAGANGAVSDPDDAFLASALFTDTTFGEAARSAPATFRKKISELSAINSREEVSLIAGMVKRSLRSGVPADSILVAFPALDAYGPLVEELFTDYGIPYNRALGRQLSSSPVPTSVITLLRAIQEDFSGPALQRIFSSPFLKFAEKQSLAPALDHFMRTERITGGKQKWISRLKHQQPGKKGGEALNAPLHDLFTALSPFDIARTAPLSDWMQKLDALIAWSGLGKRVDQIHGALNINLQAYRKLNETLSSLSLAGRLFPQYSYTFNEWLFLLKKTFMHVRFQVPPDDESGVQVLGFEESAGHAWKEIYLGGLIDNTFPQRLPQNIFLPEATLEDLGVRTLERARLSAAYHFYRLLLSAPDITLTRPENDGDRPAMPSPFLEELTPLRQAGLINRTISRTTGIQFGLTLEDSNSIPELAKALAVVSRNTDLQFPAHGDTIEGMAGIRAAVLECPNESLSGHPGSLKKEFRVTELDEYLSCPYDYYVRRVLGIEPLAEATEDISPLDRGSAIHHILRTFYDRAFGKRPVTGVSRDEALLALRDLAVSAFSDAADTFRNRNEKDIFLSVMAERFLDAEEAFWRQGMRPEYLEQKIERFRLALGDGVEVELNAKIDRIDVDQEGNFMIVDYKTGGYPGPMMGIEQDIFQLPMYAVMARSSLPALKRPVGLAYYDLKGKNRGTARDVVLFDKEARNDHPSIKPKASSKQSTEFEEILKRSMDRARSAIEGIRAGQFPKQPRDEGRCRYCANREMCSLSGLGLRLR